MDILIKGMDEIPEDGAVLVVKHDNGKAYIKHACTYGYSMELVKLPAVQPDHVADISKKAEKDHSRPSRSARQGRWIKLDLHAHLADHKCTACGQECYVPTCMGEPMYAYCPNCGVRMDGEA